MSRNDITGDRIASRPASDEFRAAFDRIFGEVRRIPAPCSCAKCRAKAAGREADREGKRERRREAED